MFAQNKPCFLTLAATLLAGIAVPAAPRSHAVQVPFHGWRARRGNTEPVADIVLSCTRGTPTRAGLLVAQINLSMFLNTNIRNLVTEHNSTGLDFSEALLLVDEPNLGNPLLNCGNIGAPDNGPLVPGVCEITSTGNPAQTYDGRSAARSGCAAAVGSLLSWPGCDFRDSNHTATCAHGDSSFRHCRPQSHRGEIASAKLRAVGSGTRQEGPTF
jgi:hypothetical protein